MTHRQSLCARAHRRQSPRHQDLASPIRLARAALATSFHSHRRLQAAARAGRRRCWSWHTAGGARGTLGNSCSMLPAAPCAPPPPVRRRQVVRPYPRLRACSSLLALAQASLSLRHLVPPRVRSTAARGCASRRADTARAGGTNPPGNFSAGALVRRVHWRALWRGVHVLLHQRGHYNISPLRVGTRQLKPSGSARANACANATCRASGVGSPQPRWAKPTATPLWTRRRLGAHAPLAGHVPRARVPPPVSRIAHCDWPCQCHLHDA